MTTTDTLRKLTSHMILDLDGTLLNTDGVLIEVMGTFLAKYGKECDHKRIQKIVGKTPLEAATAVVEDYELPCSTKDLLSQLIPLFSDQWKNIKALPGAYRLVRHLTNCGIPFALASNSSSSNMECKISYHNGWKDTFSIVIGGDTVQNGKPSPDIFIQAATRMSVEPSKCLVIEDSVPGVIAGKAAGMAVVAVPSVPKQAHLFSSADEVINSLLDFHPEKWGFPPFQDWIEETLPIEPWFIGGPVIKGFGRGSKLLGIPTAANLAAKNFSSILSEQASGVYFGWAGLASKGIFKMVASIGWNPYFDNSEKTIEPWLLHEFAEDFYAEELHLAIVGYIRPEANFPSLDSLITRIREDGRIAKKALDIPPYIGYKGLPYLKEILQA